MLFRKIKLLIALQNSVHGWLSFHYPGIRIIFLWMINSWIQIYLFLKNVLCFNILKQKHQTRTTPWSSDRLMLTDQMVAWNHQSPKGCMSCVYHIPQIHKVNCNPNTFYKIEWLHKLSISSLTCYQKTANRSTDNHCCQVDNLGRELTILQKTKKLVSKSCFLTILIPLSHLLYAFASVWWNTLMWRTMKLLDKTMIVAH